ncbi:MAG: EI24 domain-containing protein [Proteobacteria bacterium]|nr:EI24 domain-containing protein [Pseudomonadota bacterium]
MILGAIFAALGQFGDPRFRRVVWLGLGLSVALLFALYWLLVLVIQLLVPDSVGLPWIGPVGGLDTALTLASIPVMLLLSVFLMVPVASAFSGFFLDEVADAVEAEHYPQLPPADRAGFWDSLKDALRYTGLFILLNLIGLIIVIFTAGLGFVVFWAINGYLLAQEYFTTVALRRMGPAEAARMRSANMGTLWIAGVLFAIPLSVPVLNLFVPVFGVAAFTHLFHRIAMR